MFKKIAIIGAAVSPMALVANAHAALPAGVTDALADIGEDAVTLATTVLLAVVAVFAIKFLRKGL